MLMADVVSNNQTNSLIVQSEKIHAYMQDNDNKHLKLGTTSYKSI